MLYPLQKANIVVRVPNSLRYKRLILSFVYLTLHMFPVSVKSLFPSLLHFCVVLTYLCSSRICMKYYLLEISDHVTIHQYYRHWSCDSDYRSWRNMIKLVTENGFFILFNSLFKKRSSFPHQLKWQAIYDWNNVDLQYCFFLLTISNFLWNRMEVNMK